MLYLVAYKEHSAADVSYLEIWARNRSEAYDVAVYEELPTHGIFPYSAWVAEVMYKNGKTHAFNSFEGKRY